MIKIYLFTYAGDEDEAIACVKCAAAALPEAAITVVDDGAAPVSEHARKELLAIGVHYRQSSFPRNGNLRGPECVRGIISTLADKAADNDVVVKIDSDTAILSGDWVRSMQGSGLALRASSYVAPQQPTEPYAYGLCYALSGRAARLAAELLEYSPIPPLAPEDLTIFRAVEETSGAEQIQLYESWTPHNREGKWTAWNWLSIAVTPEKYAGFHIVTFGNPRPAHIPKSERARAMNELFHYRFGSAVEESNCTRS